MALRYNPRRAPRRRLWFYVRDFRKSPWAGSQRLPLLPRLTPVRPISRLCSHRHKVLVLGQTFQAPFRGEKGNNYSLRTLP